MPRPEFEQVVAAAPRERLETKTYLYDDSEIPAGDEINVDYFAPIGYTARLQSVYVEVPAVSGATTGEQEVIVTHTDPPGGYTRGSAAYSKGFILNQSEWQDADEYHPADIAAVATSIRDVLFDDVVGLRLIFRNQTDAAQTDARKMKINYVEQIQAN